MTIQEVTLPLPENIYLRLQQVAKATQQSFTDVLLHAVEIGSPPGWEDAPAEFQADLAALDRLTDNALWKVARNRYSEEDFGRHQELLDKNAEGTITEAERAELVQLRKAADRLMLRKAHAVALLRWRGYIIPPADKV